jgi:uncharacterized membrane protein
MQARLVLVASASLAYVAASQWLMTKAPDSPWAAFTLLTPMLVIVAVWAWGASQRWASLCAVGAIVALFARALMGGAANVEGLYLAQHVLIHLFLASWFGSSLRRGVRPIVSGLAARVHRQMTAPMWRYTRNVTIAWTLYFLSMALLSGLLYAAASFDIWALFANLLTPVAVTAMFAGEYLLRYWLHPDFERVSMLDAVRVYMQPEIPPAVPPTEPGAH